MCGWKARSAGISKKNTARESSCKRAAGKVGLMVAAWACCHQALRNRADRFLCGGKKTCSIGHARHKASFQSLPQH